MLVRVCDVCQKVLDRTKEDYLEIGTSRVPNILLCRACARPILKELSKQKLLPGKLLLTLQPKE